MSESSGMNHSRGAVRLVGTLVTVGLFATWLLLFRPPALGGTASFVGVDGISMTGTFSNGSLAIVERKSSYHVGDIIAYRIPAGDPGAGDNIIHRIVAGNGTTGFVTKGDHNSYTDHFWHPKTADVIGRVWFVIPGGSNLLSKLREPAVLAVVVSLVSFALFAWPSGRKEDPDPEAVGEAGPSDAEEGAEDEAPGSSRILAADDHRSGDLEVVLAGVAGEAADPLSPYGWP